MPPAEVARAAVFQSRGRDLLIGKQLQQIRDREMVEFQSRGRDLLIGKKLPAAFVFTNNMFQSRGRDLLIGKWKPADRQSLEIRFSPVVGIY